MIRAFALLALLASPAFAQAPPQTDPIIADLQGAWQAKAYGDAQSLKAIEAILKAWQADKAALAEARKEIDALKAKDKPE